MRQRSNGLWVEDIRLPDGKYKQISAKTKPALKKKLLAFQTDQDAERRFFAAADAWDNYHASKTTYNGNKVYAAPLRRAKEHFGDQPMSKFTPDSVQAWVRALADQGYSRRSVQLHLDMLRMIFDYAIVQPGSGLMHNPCGAVRIPSGLPQTRRLPPTDEQLERVTPDAESNMGLFAFFLLYTGLRRGELLALRWEDIDFDEKVIRVTKSVYYEGNQPLIKSPKTDAGTREVDLLEILEEALPRGGTGYVFGGEKPLTKIQFRKQWISFCREVGFVEKIETTHTAANGRVYTRTDWKPTVTPHQFRHAYASMLDDAGIDETAAKDLLGHASIVTTKDVYTHLRQQKRKRIGSALNEYIKEQHRDSE